MDWEMAGTGVYLIVAFAWGAGLGYMLGVWER